VTVAYLGLGSNLGDRAAHLAGARRRLAEQGVKVLRESAVLESDPYGFTEQPRFLNQVLEVEWLGSARDLLGVAKAVERDGGRTPSFRWGPREIDVDILLFGDDRICEPDLVVPHPGLLERPFVIVPLRELRPDILSQ
jgi:2-amino-4-hydroxy-6-hydroxymethyldihydropteridine diphosphokinase